MGYQAGSIKQGYQKWVKDAQQQAQKMVKEVGREDNDNNPK